MCCKHNLGKFFYAGAGTGVTKTLHTKRWTVFRDACFLLSQFSDPGPEFPAWIVRIKFGDLTEEFFSALVAGHGNTHFHFHDLIATPAILSCRLHTFFPQAQLLAGLRSGRNLQKRTAVDGGDLNF